MSRNRRGKGTKVKGGFSLLPHRTVNGTLLNSSSCFVYMAMLTKYVRDGTLNPDHKVKITQKQIEDITGLAHSTVVRAIKSLEKTGVVETVEQGGLLRNPSEYRLNPEHLY